MKKTRNHPPGKGKKALFTLIVLAASLLAAGVLAEVFLRLVPIPGVGFHASYYDELTGGILHPNATVIYRNARGDFARRRVNSLGCLDAEHAIEKPRGVTRIGFFGDSYTEAMQVPLEQTFFRLVENRLNNDAAAGGLYECLSFGLSGFSTLQSYLQCTRWMDPLDLDWVVYAFVENDPGDQVRAVKRSDGIPYAYLTGDTFAVDTSFRERYGHKASRLHRAAQYMKSRSLVVSTIKSRITLLKERGVKLRVREEEMDMAGGGNGALTPETPPSQWPDSLRAYAAELGDRVLTAWINDVRSSGRRFALVYIARKREVAKPFSEQDSWAAWLEAVCKREGVDLIDPSGEFASRMARGEEIYYDHLTARGHAALADVLAQYFERIAGK